VDNLFDDAATLATINRQGVISSYYIMKYLDSFIAGALVLLVPVLFWINITSYSITEAVAHAETPVDPNSAVEDLKEELHLIANTPRTRFQ
jgi:hypothetical protein